MDDEKFALAVGLGALLVFVLVSSVLSAIFDSIFWGFGLVIVAVLLIAALRGNLREVFTFTTRR